MKRIVLLAVALALPACDDDDSNSDAAGACQPQEVTLSYFAEGQDEPADECQPWPAACDGLDDPCFDDDCISALYELCEAPSVGAACASVGDDTFVSCNE